MHSIRYASRAYIFSFMYKILILNAIRWLFGYVCQFVGWLLSVNSVLYRKLMLTAVTLVALMAFLVPPSIRQ